MRKPANDHTGEIWLNRQITGPDEYRLTPSGKRVWSWRWKCLECGATGIAKDYQIVKHHSHLCGERWQDVVDRRTEARLTANEYAKAIPYVPPEKTPSDPAKLCSKQCMDCGHSYASTTLMCLYVLDTGHPRPKVADLRTDPCPVRDENFHRSPVSLTYGMETAEAQEDTMRRVWAEDNG